MVFRFYNIALRKGRFLTLWTIAYGKWPLINKLQKSTWSRKWPLGVSMVTGFTLSFTADVTAQKLFEPPKENGHDWIRSLRMGGYAFLVWAPVGFMWFNKAEAGFWLALRLISSSDLPRLLALERHQIRNPFWEIIPREFAENGFKETDSWSTDCVSDIFNILPFFKWTSTRFVTNPT